MTGSRLSRMRLAGGDYDPAALVEEFETPAKARADDRDLRRCFIRARDKGYIDVATANDIIERLLITSDEDFEDEMASIEVDSLASRVLNRERRRKLASQIAAYLDKTPYERLGWITLIDYREWEPLRSLARVRLPTWTTAFRKDLYDRMPEGWVGELFGFWELQAEPNRKIGQFHKHLLATDQVYEAIRAHAAELESATPADHETVKVPVDYEDVETGTLKDILALSTYPMKFGVSAKRVSMPDANGKTKRATMPHYMNDQMKAQCYMFMDAQTIDSLIITMGVTATKEGFISTRHRNQNTPRYTRKAN
jgi:hypothetical protein